MVAYSTPPEAIDERFIQILIKELGPKAPPVPGADDDHAREPAARSVSRAEDLLPAFPEAFDDTPTDELPPSPDQPTVATGPRVLRVVEPGEQDQIVRLSGRPVGIGRSRINTVVVRCPSVSRKHIRVWTEAGAVWIEEMTGNHRMSVNGIKMPRARLQLNDEVQVGSVKIYLEPEESGE